MYKTEKVNIPSEFFIFKLVYVPNFSFNKQFSFFGTNLPQERILPIKNRKNERRY